VFSCSGWKNFQPEFFFAQQQNIPAHVLTLQTKVLFMESPATQLDTLRDIRAIMDRSARFISLSGWSGVWAGCAALAGAAVAHRWLQAPRAAALLRADYLPGPDDLKILAPFLVLGIAVFAVALAGGYFFTRQKARRQGQRLWSPASRQVFWSMAVPLGAGAMLVLAMLWYGVGILVAPTCLLFYGLALIGAGRHTLSEVRYLGWCQLALAALNLALPGYGLYFWAAGFGALHILYGLVMWRRHDRPLPVTQNPAAA